MGRNFDGVCFSTSEIGAEIWGHGFYGFLPGKLYPIQIHVRHPCNAQGFMGRLREIVPLAALVAVTFRKTSDTKTSSNKNHQKSSKIIKQSPKKTTKSKQPNKNNPWEDPWWGDAAARLSATTSSSVEGTGSREVREVAVTVLNSRILKGVYRLPFINLSTQDL